MNGVAQIAALIGALAYIGAAPVEMFFVNRPAAQKFLHVEADNLADVRMWAFVVGFRNMLVGIAAIIGLIMLHNGNADTGEVVVLTTRVHASGQPCHGPRGRARVLVPSGWQRTGHGRLKRATTHRPGYRERLGHTPGSGQWPCGTIEQCLTGSPTIGRLSRVGAVRELTIALRSDSSAAQDLKPVPSGDRVLLSVTVPTPLRDSSGPNGPVGGITGTRNRPGAGRAQRRLGLLEKS